MNKNVHLHVQVPVDFDAEKISYRKCRFVAMEYNLSNIIGSAKDSLNGNQVLVFYGNVLDFDEKDCLHLLSSKESVKAEQYLLPPDRHRYIIAKAVLKRLLSMFSSFDEQEIQFDLGRNGKLFLSCDPDLQFNISHAGNAFAIALARGLETGIDVEDLNRDLNIPKLENYLFTPSEVNLFQDIHPDEEKEFFLRCWTKKEAMLKASGDGLTKAMNTLELPLINNEHWYSESFTLMDNYCGTVAVMGKANGVRYIPVGQSGSSFYNKAI